MKYPDISKAVEQEILASYEKLYRLAFSYVSDDQVQEERQEDRYEDTDIMVALDTLEEKERKVIMLKVFEEWTIREIADCLHENPNTVKSMLYRGLKKLRGKVEAEMV